MNTVQVFSLLGLSLLMVAVYYAGMWAGWKRGFIHCRTVDDFFMKKMKQCMDQYHMMAEQEIRRLKALVGEPYESGQENSTTTGPKDSGVREADSKIEA